MSMSTFQKLLIQAESKLARQEAAVKQTVQHIAGLRRLVDQEEEEEKKKQRDLEEITGRNPNAKDKK